MLDTEKNGYLDLHTFYTYLRRYGIDIIKVKKWFQTDLETYKKIMNIIEKTEVVKDIIGISTYESDDKDAGIVCAKAADELLTIGNISTSFVFANTLKIILTFSLCPLCPSNISNNSISSPSKIISIADLPNLLFFSKSAPF